MIYLSVRKEYICRISKINSAMELEIGGTILSFGGIITGLATFIIIGGFHPIVIKAEYYFGTRCWWVFLVSGIVFAVLSLFIENSIASTIVGVVAFSCLWSILELFEQKKRVEKGWFPANPKKKR